MDKQQLSQLIDKILNGTASSFEKRQFDDWYNEENNREVIWEGDSYKEEELVNRRMLKSLKGYVNISQAQVVPFYKKHLPKVAAVIAGLAIISAIYYHSQPSAVIKGKPLSASFTAPKKFTENKYVNLPDGSKVLLHPGSHIQYAFNGKTRLLTLTGEAYFDVKHKADQPFIIRSGRIITTVLGTAFDISAYPGQKVIVSVTRGKVSVADDKYKTLAVLTPDRQVIYNQDAKVVSEQPVIAQKTIAWVKSDMQFTDMPFKELTEKLSRRYDVTVKFKNADLKKYLITGRFNGTESLEDVLKVLCGTSSATYSIDSKTVVLDKSIN